MISRYDIKVTSNHNSLSPSHTNDRNLTRKVSNYQKISTHKWKNITKILHTNDKISQNSTHKWFSHTHFFLFFSRNFSALFFLGGPRFSVGSKPSGLHRTFRASPSRTYGPLPFREKFLNCKMRERRRRDRGLPSGGWVSAEGANGSRRVQL